MALHDMTSGDFTHDTQNTYTHNKHRRQNEATEGGMAGDVTSVRQFGSILR